jgi:GTP-binding protein EngB required for normal cell division
MCAGFLRLRRRGVSDLPVDRGRPAPAGANGLAAALERTSLCIDRFALDASTGARWLADLRQRLSQQRLQIAVLGQFKRGKSTFLNALLGDDVLPAAVVPLTAVPVFIEHGSRASLCISFADGRQTRYDAEQGHDLRAQLHRFATEEGNSGNHLGVERLRLFHPAPLLRSGLVLIDTPGVGSTLAHNTRATLDFLAECDAALFVVSPDPPITQAEIEFLAEIRNHAARLVFVLNKIDYLENEDREAAVAFLRRVLEQAVGLDPKAPLFCISARQALRGVERGDRRLLEQSGLPAVTRHLLDVVAPQKGALLENALSRKAAQALEGLLVQVQLEHRSLTLPLEDLERRLDEFERALADIQRQRLVARDLLAGEKSRALELLEKDCEEIRSTARRLLEGVVEEAFVAPGAEEWAVAAKAAVAASIRDYFPDELARMSRLWQQRLADLLAPHQRRAGELGDLVRHAAADLFDVPVPGAGPTDAFEAQRKPYWVTGEFSVTLDSVVQEAVTDRFLSARARQARQRRRLLEEAGTLVRRNVENLRWATLQNINEAFRRFGAQLDQDLADTIQATHGAIRAAHAKRLGSSRSVAGEVERLTQATGELTALLAELPRPAPPVHRPRPG